MQNFESYLVYMLLEYIFFLIIFRIFEEICMNFFYVNAPLTSYCYSPIIILILEKEII